jgi:DICT domain-containing protein
LPVFALDITQAETLVHGFASAGSYAVEIFMDYDTGIEQRLLVSAVQFAGVWEREFDALGNPVALPISSAQFPTPDHIYQYIDQQNLQPIGYIVEQHDHNGTDPGGDPWDQNGTNPGTGGDHNGTEGLPVFALDITQAETLVHGFASAGSYAVEIFMDYDTGIEQRLLVSAVQFAGVWEREFDALGNPVALPISSAQFPTPDHIYQYIDQQNLQPIGYIVEQHDHNGTDPGGDPWDQNGTNPGTGGDHNGTEGLPVFALDITQAETLVHGFASAGSYAVEIFMDYDTGIEQRLLVSAVQFAGVWEREFDALGNPVALPISSAQFPTPDHIYQYIDQQNLQPIGYIVEQHDHNGTDQPIGYIVGGTDPGGDPWDYNSSEPQESPANRPLLTTLSNPTIEISKQVSDSIFFNQTEEIIVQGNFAEGDVFEASFDFSHITLNRIYFRAFARNSLFESFGSKKRAKIPEIETMPELILFPDAEN